MTDIVSAWAVGIIDSGDPMFTLAGGFLAGILVCLLLVLLAAGLRAGWRRLRDWRAMSWQSITLGVPWNGRSCTTQMTFADGTTHAVKTTRGSSIGRVRMPKQRR